MLYKFRGYKEQKRFDVHKGLCIYTVVLCESATVKSSSITLHKEHIAGGNAYSSVIHVYNSETLKDMPHKQQIVGVYV